MSATYQIYFRFGKAQRAALNPKSIPTGAN